jgi:hypothetical protein
LGRRGDLSGADAALRDLTAEVQALLGSMSILLRSVLDA